MDYYKILNVKEDATLKQIEQAYLDLSSFYNPENNISKVAYKRYREINKAYNVLKEIKQREMYNLSRKEDIKKDEEIKENKKIEYKDFYKESYNLEVESIAKFKDEPVSDNFSDYTYLKYKIPYLYYLFGSEYEIEYSKKEINKAHGICPVCKGIGKVKKDDKIIYCKSCLSTGKQISWIDKIVREFVKVDKRVILEDSKVVVEFDFYDEDEYVINGNEIYLKYKVNENEFYNGVNIFLKNKDNSLLISEKDFKDLNKQYIYLDKIINVEYILGEYTKPEKRGYIVSDREIVYLNLEDFSYSFVYNDIYNYKVELNNKIIRLDDLKHCNYQLVIEVIKLENEKDLKIFFDREIVKVSPFVFKFKGSYKTHKFSMNKKFDYDDKYLYLPSLAYKLKLKNYLIFNLIFIIGYLIVPLILFLILGISYAFFIVSGIYLLLYLVIVNFLMEVKI